MNFLFYIMKSTFMYLHCHFLDFILLLILNYKQSSHGFLCITRSKIWLEIIHPCDFLLATFSTLYSIMAEDSGIKL